jgi:hypothetical protein
MLLSPSPTPTPTECRTFSHEPESLTRLARTAKVKRTFDLPAMVLDYLTSSVWAKNIPAAHPVILNHSLEKGTVSELRTTLRYKHDGTGADEYLVMIC